MSTKKVEKAELESYLREARTWETDKVLAHARSARVAWIVAGVAVFLAIVCAAALALMQPLKEVVPVVIRVNANTGATDLVTRLGEDNSIASYEEVIDRYFLQQYLRYREGYSAELAMPYLTAAAMMSSPQEKAVIAAVYQGPESPVRLYGRDGKINIVVRSLSFIEPGKLAQVRYTKQIVGVANAPPPTHWQATIGFRYVNQPLTERERAINPLGFQVVSYRIDPDAALVNESVAQPIAREVAPAAANPQPAQSPAVPAQ